MFTNKILNPRKIDENKRESRNIGFEADIVDYFQASLQILFQNKFKSAL